MIKAAQAVGREVAEAYSYTLEKITEIGKTAEGWILCESESGRTLLMEPATGELIPAY